MESTAENRFAHSLTTVSKEFTVAFWRKSDPSGEKMAFQRKLGIPKIQSLPGVSRKAGESFWPMDSEIPTESFGMKKGKLISLNRISVSTVLEEIKSDRTWEIFKPGWVPIREGRFKWLIFWKFSAPFIPCKRWNDSLGVTYPLISARAWWNGKLIIGGYFYGGQASLKANSCLEIFQQEICFFAGFWIRKPSRKVKSFKVSWKEKQQPWRRLSPRTEWNFEVWNLTLKRRFNMHE